MHNEDQSPITWRQLKEFCESLTEDELDQTVIHMLDDEPTIKIIEAGKIEADIYAHNDDGEDCGPMEVLREVHSDDPEFKEEDYYVCTEKGRLYLY